MGLRRVLREARRPRAPPADPRLHDPCAGPPDPAPALPLRARRDAGDAHAGARHDTGRRDRGMTAEGFVRELAEQNQAALRRLEAEAPLAPEVHADLTVPH